MRRASLPPSARRHLFVGIIALVLTTAVRVAFALHGWLGAGPAIMGSLLSSAGLVAAAVGLRSTFKALNLNGLRRAWTISLALFVASGVIDLVLVLSARNGAVTRLPLSGDQSQRAALAVILLIRLVTLVQPSWAAYRSAKGLRVDEWMLTRGSQTSIR